MVQTYSTHHCILPPCFSLLHCRSQPTSSQSPESTLQLKRHPNAGSSGITAQELKRRTEAGEDFIITDARNPQAWGQSDTMMPEAIRIPLDESEQNLSLIAKNRPVVTYGT